MNRYITAVLLLQCSVKVLLSHTKNPANTTNLTWREILPDYCGYRHEWLKEKMEELKNISQPHARKVTGGQQTTIEDHPWQVAVLSFPGRDFKFGGSIISKYHVLTAAHCFIQKNSEKIINVMYNSTSVVSHKRLKVAVGSTRHAESKLLYAISEVYIHGAYSDSYLRHDIALLKIDGEFEFNEFVWPICLPAENESYDLGRECQISGFGDVASHTTNSKGWLVAGSVSLKLDTICKSTTGKKLSINITQGMFCAAGEVLEEVATDTCEGDSGGPLNCQHKNAPKQVLLGITSFGYGCGMEKYPGVYTKVSEYLQWIHDRVEGRFKDEIQIKNGRTTQKPASIEFPTDCGVMKPRMPLSADMANVTANDANFHIEKTPWLVALMFAKHKTHWACGAIISKKYVLTAAHGVYAPARIRFSDVPMVEFILAGDPSLQESERKYKIARIIFHPEYNPSTYENDLALIETNDEFIFSDKIQPICMPYDELYRVNFNFIFTSWHQGELSSTTGLYRRVHELADKSQCSKNYFGNELTTNKFCSVVRNGEETAVSGDLGGPLFANEGARHYLLGVFSWRLNTVNVERYPRIFMKVINYKEWIREVMTGVISENSMV